MNYAGVKIASIENGVGCRTSMFVSGCTHHCDECFNAETWDFNYGNPVTKEVEDRVLDSLKPRYIDGITFLGGEPLEPENQPGVRSLVERIRKEVPGKTIWVYTGYTWEELQDPTSRAHTEHTLPLLAKIDILVDGRYEKEKKNLLLQFRGSENQRVIDVQETLKQKDIVLSEHHK